VMAHARLLRDTNDSPGAAKALEWLSVQPPKDSEERIQLATLLADVGRLDRAIEIMEQAGGEASDQALLVLGELYQRARRTHEVEQLFTRLAGKPSLTSIILGANRLAAQGKEAQARSLLDTLAALHLPAGTAELAIARHLSRFEGAKIAMPAYQKTCSIAPHNAAAWKELIACCVEAAQALDATSAAAAGAVAIPTDLALSELRAHADLLAYVVSQPDLRGLVGLLIENPTKDAPVVQAIRAVQDQTPGKIADLADSFPALFPLQRLAFSRDVARNRMYHAVTIADRTVRIFPTLAEPCGWLFASHAALGEWSEALAAATQWRDRCLQTSPSQCLNAEIARAQCQLKLGKAADAVTALEPYVDHAIANPGASSRLIQTYVFSCRSMIEKFDAAKLRARLRPLLQSPPGRELWMSIAAEFPDPADAFVWLVSLDATPAVDTPSRLAMADAWLQLAARHPRPECYSHVRTALAPLLSGDNCPSRAILITATLAQQEGDLGGAEAGYRRVLSMGAGEDLATVRPIAANNLASLILHRSANSKELDEAVALVIDAITARKDAAAFHDTLAALYSKRQQYSLAASELREAARLAPTAARYRVRLAQALADGGDVAAAHATARELENENATNQALSDAERRQLVAILKLPDSGSKLPVAR